MAGHLVQRTYSEPHWDAQRGAAMAYERVTLYGLPLVPRRRVGYAAVDPEVARELFLRHALVEGDWQTRHHFFRDNQALRAELEEIEERARRRDLLVGDDELYAFYDARVPASAVSAAALRRVVEEGAAQDARPADDDPRRPAARATTPTPSSPTRWRAGDLALPVSYRFEPGADDDGVTVHVPVDVLARLGGDEFAWQVPALREELVTALIRSLPKDLRRNFVPGARHRARRAGRAAARARSRCSRACSASCSGAPACSCPLDAFDLDKLPVAPAGHVRGRGRRRRRGRARQGPAGAAGAARRAGARRGGRGGRRRARAHRPDGLARRPGRAARRRCERAQRRARRARLPGLRRRRRHGRRARLRRPRPSRPRRCGAALRRLLRLSTPSPAKAVERSLVDPGPAGARRQSRRLARRAARRLRGRRRRRAGARSRCGPATAFAELRDRVAAELVPTTIAVVGRVERGAGRRPRRPARPARAAGRRPQADASTTSATSSAGCCRRGSSPATGAASPAPTWPATSPRSAGASTCCSRDVDADRGRMQRVHAVQDAYDELVARAAGRPGRGRGRPRHRPG